MKPDQTNCPSHVQRSLDSEVFKFAPSETVYCHCIHKAVIDVTLLGIDFGATSRTLRCVSCKTCLLVSGINSNPIGVPWHIKLGYRSREAVAYDKQVLPFYFNFYPQLTGSGSCPILTVSYKQNFMFLYPWYYRWTY